MCCCFKTRKQPASSLSVFSAFIFIISGAVAYFAIMLAVNPNSMFNIPALQNST